MYHLLQKRSQRSPTSLKGRGGAKSPQGVSNHWTGIQNRTVNVATQLQLGRVNGTVNGTVELPTMTCVFTDFSPPLYPQPMSRLQSVFNPHPEVGYIAHIVI